MLWKLAALLQLEPHSLSSELLPHLHISSWLVNAQDYEMLQPDEREKTSNWRAVIAAFLHPKSPGQHQQNIEDMSHPRKPLHSV